jgi:hypothetical protein
VPNIQAPDESFASSKQSELLDCKYTYMILDGKVDIAGEIL